MPPNNLTKAGGQLRAWLDEFVREFRVERLAFTTAEVVAVADLAYHAFTLRHAAPRRAPWAFSRLRGFGHRRVAPPRLADVLRAPARASTLLDDGS